MKAFVHILHTFDAVLTGLFSIVVSLSRPRFAVRLFARFAFVTLAGGLVKDHSRGHGDVQRLHGTVKWNASQVIACLSN